MRLVLTDVRVCVTGGGVVVCSVPTPCTPDMDSEASSAAASQCNAACLSSPEYNTCFCPCTAVATLSVSWTVGVGFRVGVFVVLMALWERVLWMLSALLRLFIAGFKQNLLASGVVWAAAITCV